MKQMTVRAVIMTVLCIIFSVGIAIFIAIYIKDGADWALYPANRHVYTDGIISQAGSITDRNGTVLCKTEDGKRVYSSNSTIRLATAHAVGDTSGFISTGVHNAFLEELTGYNLVNGVYSLTGNGSDIRLTLDADVCATALQALGSYKGVVGAYNYKTGELLCMVSTPTVDVSDSQSLLAAKEDEESAAFLNRFISATYPPGSTFKVVTATAAIETFDDAYEREYVCERGCVIDGEKITCMGNHGSIKLKEALAHSCNAYFSQLAADLGKETMTKYAEKFGFNKEFSLDGITAKTSSYDVDDARDVDLAWSGMGQYTDMFNPLQYLTAMGAIANGGSAKQPYIIKSVTSELGIPAKLTGSSTYSMLSKSTASKIKELMMSNVELEYGKSSFPGLSVGAKSGTAEVADGVTPNAVFVGFSADEDLPVAFVVCVENGGSGTLRAGSIANKVLQKCKEKMTGV